MTKFFIIHGTKGSPQGNWFPWLKEALEKEGHTVFVPVFPTPQGQSLENWMRTFQDGYFHLVDDDSMLIGHSLGAAFILSVLESLTLPKPVKVCFLVSGFLGLLKLKEFDELNKSFTTKRFDWTKIKTPGKRFYVINADNDPYVPLEKGKALAAHLGTEVIVLRNAGHINKESGYTQFLFLLEKINKELSS